MYLYVPEREEVWKNERDTNPNLNPNALILALILP